MAFKGKPPGGGAGEISRRTEALRPSIALTPQQVQAARTLRRSGLAPEIIAEKLSAPLDEVEKALVQMRMPRPETTRGTLNVTLAAHRLVMAERRGDEPIWQTFDRMLDELLRLRAEAERRAAPQAAPRRREPAGTETPLLPGLVQ
ncbi:MAG: hypothetical protein JSS43_33060 [Proteobacteria bacterium]|nr:hypothetical protein [Pseudomonadota bacterium]